MVIKTEIEYEAALREIDHLMGSDLSPDLLEYFEQLLDAVEDYEFSTLGEEL